ncbi:MAG: hypothetical protein IPO63_01310 [Bacteroidetes bacterium]|nr:hypothetical protein [Bacteroidota bacterium]
MPITPLHSFHIPVMGLGYTIDTPIKVGKFGISSVVSIIEDHLVEQMREIISTRENIPFEKITAKEDDSRAKRITSYLNLLQKVLNGQIQKLKNEDFDKDEDINKYFELLSNTSPLKSLYLSLKTSKGTEKKTIEDQLKSSIEVGSIDVNIMTKLDKLNYTKSGEALPQEYSDALSALRGYANSNLCSSIVFSAGLNPRLFSYCEKFEDFCPNEDGIIKKKIILKVSDYRSALIQGKYLAKKGLWISEFRIESGINCGGHAFVSNGLLLGPILEEFKQKREDLYQELFNECNKTLLLKEKFPLSPHATLSFTAQGGIGTSEEHKNLLEYYQLNSLGWGSPFLMVPEATNVDKETLLKLIKAKKTDYYISHASPLGVPFNNFKESSAEKQRKQRIAQNKPGSPCYKKFLSNNTEFTEKMICTASRQYQHLKIKQLEKTITDKTELKDQIKEATEKDCLCAGLGASAILVNHQRPSHNLTAVTICPGPNLAYFSGSFSLKQMVDHIYGRTQLLNETFRPHVFINELELYISYIKREFEKSRSNLTEKRKSYFSSFKANLMEGIKYYEQYFTPLLFVNDVVFQKNILLLEENKISIQKIFYSLDK